MDVVAGFLMRGERYLIARRSVSMRWPGLWEFPGGKVEAGESLERALVRELQEELGITAREFSLWKIKQKDVSGEKIRLFFYQVTEFSVNPCREKDRKLRGYP